MQQNAATESDRAAGVGPTPKPSASWRVVSVVANPDASTLHVRFVDNTEGDVDLRSFLSDPALEGTVFAPLRDPAFFAQVAIVMGAVQWPNGADLAPDAMYDAIREHRRWSFARA